MARLVGRWPFAGALFALFFLVAGARCVENTSVQVDNTGHTHIYGDIVNETDIQGYQMILHGRLIASDGSIIAEQDSPICPPHLTSHSQSMIDIQFAQANLPIASSFDVRAIGGAASDVALPDPKIAIVSTRAYINAGAPTLRVDVKNNSGTEYFNLNACVAAYDASGTMVAGKSARLHSSNDAGTPTPGQGLGAAPDYILLSLAGAPAKATTMRGWVWLDDGAGKQAYRPIVTGLVPIAR